MNLVLLILDQTCPLDEDMRDSVSNYMRIFFRANVRYETVTAPEGGTRDGWEALRDRMGSKLKERPGRPEEGAAPLQLFSPQLIACLEWLQPSTRELHGVPVEGVDAILALTENELFANEVGLVPNEPAPESRTHKVFVRSAGQTIGVCSLARLGLCGPTAPGFRRSFRCLLTFLSGSMLDLLGMRTCQSAKCLAHVRQPARLEETPLLLCAHCEETILKDVRPLKEAYRAAIMRYEQLFQFLNTGFMPLSQSRKLASQKHMTMKVGYRHYHEFEEECDWLRQAEAIIVACEREDCVRVDVSGKSKVMKRSLFNGLREAHERPAPAQVSQRTYSEPLLRRTCLVDMTSSAPYRHNIGDLSNWCQHVVNKQHSTGGIYVELGGSNNPKVIASFVDAGLNAYLLWPPCSHTAPTLHQQAETRQRNQYSSPDRKGSLDKKSQTAMFDGRQRRQAISKVIDEPATRRRNARSLGYTIGRKIVNSIQ